MADESGLDEKDKLIRSMEKELRNLREGIISLRQDQNKAKFIQQRLDQTSAKLVQATARVTELEDQHLKEE